MLMQIKTFFAPPVFADEDTTRLARTLNIVLLTILAALLVTVPLEYLLRLRQDTTAGLSLFGPVAILVLLGLFFLMRRGQVKIVGLFLALFLFVQVTGVILQEGGTSNAVTSGYIVAILVAGLLAGGWAAVGMAVLSGVAILGVVYAQTSGIYPIPPGDGAPAISYPSIFLVVAITLRLAVDSLNKALAETRSHKNALQTAQIESEKQATTRQHDLQAVVNVSRLLVQTADLQTALNHIVETIRSSFNLYYAQIYLADSAGRTLILRAGTGDVGATLVQRGHRLLIGLGSINGAAAAQKQAVVVQDINKSSVHQINPLLPLTRSAMAVPMVANNRLLGTLNLQSEQPGLLNNEVLPVFEALAAQLALAIYNDTLFAEAQQATSLMEAQSRQVVAAGWDNLLNGVDKVERMSVVYELTTDTPLPETPANLDGLTVPVKVVGQPIGTIRLHDDAGRTWEEEELEVVRAVADKVARQVENLRLLAQADQYRVEAENAARRLTREGWAGYLTTADSALAYTYDLNRVSVWDVNTGKENRTAVSHPLQIYGEQIGELILNDLETADKNQTALIEAIANKVSTRLETIRLAQQTEQALAQTEALYLGSEQIIRAQNMEDVLFALVKNSSLHKLDQAIVLLYNRPWLSQMPETVNSVATWEKSEDRAVAAFNSYPLQQFPFIKFISRDHPILVPDIMTDPRADENLKEQFGQLGLRGMINLPLGAGGTFLGSIVGISKDVLQLNDEEIKQLSSLTDLAWSVIQNLRLYEETQARAEEERLVNEITRKIQGTSSIENALQTAIQELGMALQARYTAAELASTYIADNTNGHTA